MNPKKTINDTQIKTYLTSPKTVNDTLNNLNETLNETLDEILYQEKL